MAVTPERWGFEEMQGRDHQVAGDDRNEQIDLHSCLLHVVQTNGLRHHQPLSSGRILPLDDRLHLTIVVEESNRSNRFGDRRIRTEEEPLLLLLLQNDVTEQIEETKRRRKSSIEAVEI